MGVLFNVGLWLGCTVALWPIRGGSRRLKRQDEMIMNKDFGRAGPTLSGIQFLRYAGRNRINFDSSAISVVEGVGKSC